MKSFNAVERHKQRGGMELVTLQRSPSVAGTPPQCGSEGETEEDESSKHEESECFSPSKGTAMVLTPKDIHMQNAERRLSTDSTKSTNSTQSNNSDIQQHLQSMIHLLRPRTTLKIAVKLESQRANRTRYLVIASHRCYRNSTTDRRSKIIRHHSAKVHSSSTFASAASAGSINETNSSSNVNATRQLSVDGSFSGSGNGNGNKSQQQQQAQLANVASECVEIREKRLSSSSMSGYLNRQSVKCDGDKNSTSEDCKFEGDGVEESCLLGIDCNERTTIGLVVPILADTTIHLDGDGGFSVSVYGRTHIFKPASVQAMWSALQMLHKVSQKARENNFYPGGPSHDWLSDYENRIESERSCLNEWNAMDSLESRRPPSPDAIRNKPTAKEETESVIKMKLKEIMMSVDLDEVTSKYIRGRLEALLDMDLGEYKSFIDAEMLTILGQMDAPTEIFEHVYLGSEWNASNLEELQKNGVRHILNVTREIDNFFPSIFDYFNVRVYDDEKTNLLKHWDNTYKYITKAKSEGSKVLVHCKMGVSRSASVVIAYAMKAFNWEFDQAFQHVKDRRSCIKPNKNFMVQLVTYRGMLDAMKNKEKLQRSKSETNLKSTKDARLLPGSEPTPLIQALNQSKSKSTGHAVSEDGGRDTIEMGDGVGSVSSITNASDQKQRRIMRRNSSTSPKNVQEHAAIVMKQQSHSLENLTPERSVADEPKNMRFPGSNGENYSVTQNQVRHIQKDTPPPPPPPPPRTPLLTSTAVAAAAAAATAAEQQMSTSVRTIVNDLEASQSDEIRKTVDDRKSLNLPFERSLSHDANTRATIANNESESQSHREEGGQSGCAAAKSGGGPVSPVWTSSSKLITQTSNLAMQQQQRSGGVGGGEMTNSTIATYSPQRTRCDTAGSSGSNYDIGDMFSSQLDNVFAKEEEQKRHSRKTRSWTASGSDGGIIMDAPGIRMGSNSSIDSVSSSATSGAYENCVVRPRQRQRECPTRHASWGSGDNRSIVPMRNSSWGSYDTNRNTSQYSTGCRSVAVPIVEGQIHELNKSNKTAINATSPHGVRAVASTGGGGGNLSHRYRDFGTVKRTKLKLEESNNAAATQKKLCQENGEPLEAAEVSGDVGKSAIKPPPITSPPKNKGASLYRSASAAGSNRSRHPFRCNSEEFVAGGMMPRAPAAVMRRSDGSRPLHSELFSASAPESYTMSDIENKNTLPAQCSTTDGDGDLTDETVVLRNTPAAGGLSTADEQRISGTVQILKKNFEAKAGSMAPSSSSAGGTMQLQPTSNVKKGQSLPSSPVAQHVEHQTATAANLPPSSAAAATTCTTNVAISSVGQPTPAAMAVNSSPSSSSSSSSVFESCDRNVKGLVNKYQTTTTTLTSTTSTTSTSSNTMTSGSACGATASNSNLKQRPRSYYDNTHHHHHHQHQHHQHHHHPPPSSGSLIGKPHEYSASRPPPAPFKNVSSTSIAANTATPMTESLLQHQNQQQQQAAQQQQPAVQPHRRLQQHGKTHPLSRLSLSKQSFNAATYNTM